MGVNLSVPLDSAAEAESSVEVLLVLSVGWFDVVVGEPLVEWLGELPDVLAGDGAAAGVLVVVLGEGVEAVVESAGGDGLAGVPVGPGVDCFDELVEGWEELAFDLPEHRGSGLVVQPGGLGA